MGVAVVRQWEATNNMECISLQLGVKVINFCMPVRLAFESTAVKESQNVCHSKGLPSKVGRGSFGS